MIINGTVPITISEDEQRRIAIKFLKERFNVKDTFYIRDNKICAKVTYHTSHSWDDEVIIRDATELDIAFFTVLGNI